MKNITGFGDIFFKCKDQGNAKEWYKTHLGFDANQYGTRFEWREVADPSEKGFSQWNPLSETSHHFSNPTKDVMIYYLIENLEQHGCYDCLSYRNFWMCNICSRHGN